MGVVAAGVHHAGIAGSERKPRVLRHRQGVDVSSGCDYLAGILSLDRGHNSVVGL